MKINWWSQVSQEINKDKFNEISSKSINWINGNISFICYSIYNQWKLILLMKSRRNSYKHRTLSPLEKRSSLNSPKEPLTDALPKLRSKTIRMTANNNQFFDKYYIQPEYRYKQKVENPKENKQSYIDETYIYQNLHNYNYWNWAHPLE